MKIVGCSFWSKYMIESERESLSFDQGKLSEKKEEAFIWFHSELTETDKHTNYYSKIEIIVLNDQQ